MQERFRRGAISIGPAKCNGCDRSISHGEIYLAIDEKPSDKLKEEIVYIEDIDCSGCGSKLEKGHTYLFSLDGDTEKCYCQACYKKKGGDAFRKKSCGAVITFKKAREISEDLRFCVECCEKRKAGTEKTEKGEKVFTFFPAKSLK